MLRSARVLMPLVSLSLLVLLGGCQAQPAPTRVPTPTSTVLPTPSATATAAPAATRTPLPTPTSPPAPKPVPLTLTELKYRLLSNFSDFFWCDPDFYPVARQGQEEKNALEQYPAIKANAEEFAAILGQLRLPAKADYSDDEKLQVYRQHKKLTYAVQATPAGQAAGFTLRTGQNNGFRIEGTISPSGEITVLKKEQSFNTCPICLGEGTLIDTPDGPVPVERLREGMTVWTRDEKGQRVPAEVLQAVSTPVPQGFQGVKVTLSDGRSVTASPGHPTPAGTALGDLRAGDALDEAVVAASEYVAYEAGRTYDILPSGRTGLYRANGILLRSTLPGK